MKHIKSIHVIGLICIADLIFASHGFFAIVILAGYTVYRLEKCEDCPEPEKLPDPLPVPKANLNELTDLAPEGEKYIVTAKFPDGYNDKL